MADLARIKRNVAKMASQNAPMEDIDGYIASEGVSVDDVRNFNPNAAPAEDKSGIANTIDAFGRAAANMASAGWADEIGAGARYLGGKVFPWQPEVTYDQALQEVRGEDKALADAHPIADTAGKVAGVVGLGKGLTRAGLSPTSRAIDAGASLNKTALASALEGMILGGVQGAGDAEGEIKDRAASAGYGAVGGGVLGLGFPYLMAGLGSVARRAASPFLTSPERTQAAEALAREGVQTTAGQRTGSNSLRYAESELGGQAAQDFMDRQGEQFTAAALRRAGVTANRASPDVMDDAFRTIGQQFDDLASRNVVMPDADLARDLGATFREYQAMVPESHRAPVVMDTIKDIGAAMRGGPLDGAAYQALRSRLDTAARSSARDPQLQSALYGIRNALDDGMERSIAAANPGDMGAFREARRQYRNMLVLEKAGTAAGENAAQGLISPSSLRNATVSTQGRRNYARGKGDFADLARAGEAVLKPMPNSGTAGRLNAQNLGLGLAGLFGAGAGTTTGDPTTAALGAAAGFFAPRLAGKALMNPTVQRYLSNQTGQAIRMTPQVRKLMNIILNVEGGKEGDDAARSLLGP